MVNFYLCAKNWLPPCHDAQWIGVGCVVAGCEVTVQVSAQHVMHCYLTGKLEVSTAGAWKLSPVHFFLLIPLRSLCCSSPTPSCLAELGCTLTGLSVPVQVWIGLQMFVGSNKFLFAWRKPKLLVYLSAPSSPDSLAEAIALYWNTRNLFSWRRFLHSIHGISMLGLGKILARNSEESLPISVDGAELDEPGVWPSMVQLLICFHFYLVQYLSL